MPAFPWFFQDGWIVARTIDPEVAERENMPKDSSYSYPGLHATKAEAEAAMAEIRANIPDALAGERERLFVKEGRGPNAKGLAVIAYLQWLGTWDPTVGSEN